MFKVKQIYLTLLDRIETLKKEIDSILLRDFPDDAPITVIETLSVIMRCIEVQAKQDLAEDPLDNPDLKQAYLQLINSYLKLLEQVHDVIGAIANGVKTSVPWALTRTIKEVLRRYGPKDDVHVIYAPIWRLNFSIHQHRLSQLYTDLESVIEATEEGKQLKKNLPRVIAINFSYLDRKSPLLYGVLAHEIGHMFSTEYYRKNDRVEPGWALANIEPLIGFRPLDAKIRFIQEVNLARRRAIEEIGADLFAVYCIGPAFVFSVFDVLSRFLSDDIPPAQATNYYPSNRLRMKSILNALKGKWDFDKKSEDDSEEKKELRKALKTLFDLINEVEIVDNRTTDSVSIAYKYVVEIDIPQMLQELASNIDHPFDYEKFFEQASELVNRLEHNVPPNQMGVALDGWVDSVTILNVMWLCELKTMGNASWKDIGSDEHLSKLYLHDRLSLKAIELSEIQRAYRGTDVQI